MSWPGENGVPPAEVAFCPNFPDCGCTASCQDSKPRAPEGALTVLVVLAAIAIAGAFTAWLLLRGV